MRSWLTGWLPGVLPTSTTSTSEPRVASRPRGPSRSVTTTSAAASRARPRTVMRSSAPGPPPTSATRPTAAGRGLRRRAVGRPDPADGQGAAVEGGEDGVAHGRGTARVATGGHRHGEALAGGADSVPRATAGVHALEAEASSARTHQTRAASASRGHLGVDRRSPVAVWTSHAGSGSSRSPTT